jgi:lysozyme
MRLNQRGIDLIKSFEGCRLKAYPDPATGSDPWTIGWGHTGPEVHPGLTWTQKQADDCLTNDLEHFSQGVKALINIDLTDNEFSAIVSLAYNIGIGNLKHSTLLKLVNAGAMSQAAKEFYKWDMANGKVMAGLVRRRISERALFNSTSSKVIA